MLCAVNAGMLSLADVLRTVREKAPNTELVLTGRGAPEELIALADYVSVIEARKHPFLPTARHRGPGGRGVLKKASARQ